MNFSAEHVNYVLLAYGVSALVLAGLAITILRSDHAIKRKLSERDKEQQ